MLPFAAWQVSLIVSAMHASALNQSCLCTRADHDRLTGLLQRGGLPDAEVVLAPRQLFAEFPVFVSAAEIQQIRASVAAIQRVVATPAFIDHALRQAPPIAAVDQGARGVVYGYDFHLTDAGPKLIEVNTNAGGLLLNDALRQAQGACCDAVAPLLQPPDCTNDLGTRLVASFVDEFRRARGADATLGCVAIVDDQPEAQFLFPEFRMFAELFRRAGITAHIVDPAALDLRDDAVWFQGQRVDLIYNRLTDFYLEQVQHAHLAHAYTAGQVVVTPHPRAHALFANKHHLAAWSSAERLAEFGVDRTTLETLLATVPHAEIVTAENRDQLWAARKQFFFKPPCGFAGKAAYRGDKISRRTWDEQVGVGYLAQTIVQPSERVVRVGDDRVTLKLDVRAYVDQAQVVLFAARLYQGQTTNFRTPGGGFAAVLQWPQALPAQPAPAG